MSTRKLPTSRQLGTVQELIQVAVHQGKTLQHVADLAGLSLPTVTRIYKAKKGKIHPKTANAILTALSGVEKVPPTNNLDKADREQKLISLISFLQQELERI
jgi:hypothetical protein